MALYKVLVPPERSGYAFTQNPDAIQSILDGGLPRTRQDQLGAAIQVSVQWTVGRRDFNYLMAFKRQYSGQSFLIDLIIDQDSALEYTAVLVPGTFNLQSQSGETYVIQAQLYVQPLPVDNAGDNIILARNS